MKTVRRKIKKGVDGARPNFFTGEMRAIVLQTGRVTATQHQWRYRAIGTIDRPLPEWQRKELEAITAEEVSLDAQFIAKNYSRRATWPEYQRKRRRRIGATS